MADDEASGLTRVLLIGIAPDKVDPRDPDLPAGTTPDKIRAGIDATLSGMKTRGWEAGFFLILPDASAEATIARSLAEGWDCIVIAAASRADTKRAVVRAGHPRRPARRSEHADRVQHVA